MKHPGVFSILLAASAIAWHAALPRAAAQAPSEELVMVVDTSEVPAKVKSPPVALVSLLVAGGTGALILSGSDSGGGDEATDPNTGLTAPTLEGPPDDAALPDAGSPAVLTWAPVSGATSYLVDVDVCDATNNACGDYAMTMTADTSFTLQLPAPYAARWRIRAVGPDHVAGPYSGFRKFSVTEGP